MIIVNRTGESITGSINMIPFGIRYSEAKYNQLVELRIQAEQIETVAELKELIAQAEVLTKEDLKGAIEHACPFIFVDEEKGKFYLKMSNGKASSRPLPTEIAERIITSVEKKIDPLPLIKSCIRFMRCPVYSDVKFIRFGKYIGYEYLNQQFRDELIKKGLSSEVATERATVPQTPITQEGLIDTYKVSEELFEKFDAATGEKKPRYTPLHDEDTGEVVDAGLPKEVEDRVFYPAVMGLTNGDAFMCENIMNGTKKLGHLIRVGHVHYLESEDQVNCDDNNSCLPGLHVGNLDYIRTYQTGKRVTHNCFIDPMDIRAITNGGDGALRVLRYFVHSSKVGDNRGIYHSSRYAAYTDERWDQLRDEAIANAELKQAEISGDITALEELGLTFDKSSIKVEIDTTIAQPSKKK